jgi:tetratricopeptide (TPR) repeat protein
VALDPEDLARALLSALDIARRAHFAQRAWKPALHRIDAILEVQRALKRPVEDIAVTRINRAIVRDRLGRSGEAQAELEGCLQIFQNDPANRARVFNSLADLFDEQGDVHQAITQQRRALALREQLPAPGDRASSHHNLALYLERSGTPSALVESPRHQLAALIYWLIARLGQDLQTSLHNYAVRFHRVQATGTPLAVPRVAELLADPAFRALADWLRQPQYDVADVQAAVDHFLEMARQAALRQT